MEEKTIEACAHFAHEVNRMYCAALGDLSHSPWDLAPEWQKESARKGVIGAVNGNTPEQSHESWLEQKKKDGWKFGPVKDPARKEHPCFVSYEDLPWAQQAKDTLFVMSVRTLAKALGEPI